MRSRFLVPLLALSAAALTLLASAAPTPPVPLGPLGPGGVYSMHVQLFRALDAGDGAAVEKILGGERRGLCIDADGKWSEDGASLGMFLLGPGAEPFETDDAGTARKLLIAQDAVDGAKGRWTTKILDGWMDCPSGEMSFATLTFERTREVDGATVRKRYRSTSLVSFVDGGWKLWHFHVSPAGSR